VPKKKIAQNISKQKRTLTKDEGHCRNLQKHVKKKTSRNTWKYV
jgi:hypothetical protein